MTTENHDIPVSPIMVNAANLTLIREDSGAHNSLSANDICNLFNEFLAEFEQMEKSGITTTNMFLDAVEEITNAVSQILPYKLLDPKVLYHPLMYFLHQVLVDLLANWNASRLRLNIQETDIFLKITSIFVHAAEQASEPNVEEARIRIRDLLATKRFLYLVRDQIVDVSIHKEGINDDPNISTVGLLTLKLLRGCPFYYTVERNEYLIDDLVMNCLDSYDYVEALRHLQHGDRLTDIDRLILFTCWEYIPFVSTHLRQAPNGPNSINWIQDIYDALLTRLEGALEEPQPIAPASLTYIYERCYQLLNIENLQSFDKHAAYIVDHLAKTLKNPPTTNTDGDIVVIDALKAFYNLSTNTDIRTIMRKRQLTPLFNNYIASGMGEKRKLAFSILAQIMSEEEINNNPTDITVFFTDKLKKLDPKGYNPRTDIVLSSLKVLVQYEQVKNEFVKHDGLESLTSFIRDGDPTKQSDQQLEEAMQILWTCALNNPEALKTLKNDTELMARVNQLHQNAKKNENPSLEKAAEGLIWKVEKEEQFKKQQEEEAERKQQEKKRKAKESGNQEEEEEEEEEEQYDCMISYSWADMDLAHRIFHHLTEKLGYKVWLDQEQMHGSTIEAMANAVENAQFILMCMSETYKRSANCRSEAEYAFNRKKHIVPLKLKADYAPDGWLGFILGTRMYIDFGTYEFEKAIELLDNEIQLQKKKRKDAKELAKAERKAANISEEPEAVKKVSSPQVTVNVKTNPDNLASWNEGEVRDFLLKNNLTAMVPLCDGINGEELSDLYAMCKTNSASMYRSLKFELLHGHHRILPISTFLRFLSRMRAACDDGLPSNALNVKKSPEIAFGDDE